MFRLYSKKCEYTIRAMMYLVPKGGRSSFSVSEVCGKAEIPESFTRKVFQALAQKGFLRSATGPGGGYELVRSPAKIDILSIIESVEGKGTFDHCILGTGVCGRKDHCSLHQSWLKVKNHLLTELKSKTLQDLVDEAD